MTIGDGDGFCEVHVNTIEGFWSLLRTLLRPYREISREKLLARKRVLGLEQYRFSAHLDVIFFEFARSWIVNSDFAYQTYSKPSITS